MNKNYKATRHIYNKYRTDIGILKFTCIQYEALNYLIKQFFSAFPLMFKKRVIQF